MTSKFGWKITLIAMLAFACLAPPLVAQARAHSDTSLQVATPAGSGVMIADTTLRPSLSTIAPVSRMHHSAPVPAPSQKRFPPELALAALATAKRGRKRTAGDPPPEPPSPGDPDPAPTPPEPSSDLDDLDDGEERILVLNASVNQFLDGKMIEYPAGMPVSETQLTEEQIDQLTAERHIVYKKSGAK